MLRRLALAALLALPAAAQPAAAQPAAAQPAAAQPAPTRALLAKGREVLAADLEHALRRDVLEAWYPRAVDSTAGGFLSRFDYRWRPVGDQQKMIVSQARHVWTTARLAAFFPDESGMLRAASAHGLRFLRERMWDAEHGGFFWLVTREGAPVPEADGRRQGARVEFRNVNFSYTPGVPVCQPVGWIHADGPRLPVLQDRRR